MKIGTQKIGADRAWVCGEVGINANGSFAAARQMIDEVAAAGADAVKFQKRTIDLNYTEEELAAPRPGPWGETNGEQKFWLEFSVPQMRDLLGHAHHRGLAFVVSPWDVPALVEMVGIGVDAIKIPSARLHRERMLDAAGSSGLPVILSTGMNDMHEVRSAVFRVDRSQGSPDSAESLCAILACVSAYPCPRGCEHLSRIRTLLGEFPGAPIGYSSHSPSPWIPVYAVTQGAQLIEAHVTLDRSMLGSDQAASLEFRAFAKMIEEIRTFESALGDPEIRVLTIEHEVRAKLRR